MAEPMGRWTRPRSEYESRGRPRPQASCPCSKDFGDFRNPDHRGAEWEARECGAECAHIQSQAGSPAPSTASSRRLLPGLFSSRAQPAETAPQHSADLPIRDPRRKAPTPSTLTAAARKVAAALGVPNSLSVPSSQHQRHRAAGRRYRTCRRGACSFHVRSWGRATAASNPKA